MKAVWRSGGLAVGMGAAVLTAGAPGRLTAQGVVASLPASTRAAALGGAGAALVGDAGAVFSNPAGIATIRRLSLEGSYERYIAGTTLSSAAVALRAGRLSWGAGAQVLDYGTEAEVVPDPATGGRRGMPTGAFFHPYDLLAVSSLVFRRSLLALGVSGKYVRQAFGPQGGDVADAWAGDVGLAIAVFDIFALGASVQNLGAALPRRTRAGFTMNYVDPQGALRLLTTLEGQWPSGGAAQLVTGLEAGIVTGGVGLVGRLGYATRPPQADASRVTVGGGVVVGGWHVDYAFQDYSALGAGTHRVGLRWTP